jgi:hypothetical protein
MDRFEPNMSNQFSEPMAFNLQPQQQGPDIQAALRLLGGGGGAPYDANGQLMQFIKFLGEQMALNRSTQQAQRQAELEATPRPAEQYGEYAKAQRYRKDPYKAAISDVEAQRARGGTPSIDAYKAANKIPELTPAARLASQNVRSSGRPGGGSALSQWALRGGVEGIDAGEYRRMLYGI